MMDFILFCLSGDPLADVLISSLVSLSPVPSQSLVFSSRWWGAWV